MNEQQEKTRVKQAINNTLHDMTGDPFLFQRVMANAEKKETRMKYTIPKGFVIALIVVLCMGTVAVAAGVYAGAMGWSGEVISEEDADAIAGFITVEPNPEREQMEMKLNALVEQYRKDGEQLEIIVSGDGRMIGGTNVAIRRTADTMDAFVTLLAEEENLPIPGFVPEGYEFVRGDVEYSCRAGGTWLLIERMALEGGINVGRYRLEKEDMLVRRYSLVFKNPAEDDAWLWIAAELMPPGSSDMQYAGFSESQTPQVVTIPGMDDALAVTKEKEGYCYLMMRRALQEPVGYHDFHRGEGNLGECVVYADAQGIDLETLISIFSAE